jgi:hypothetical protein
MWQRVKVEIRLNKVTLNSPVAENVRGWTLV